MSSSEVCLLHPAGHDLKQVSVPVSGAVSFGSDVVPASAANACACAGHENAAEGSLGAVAMQCLRSCATMQQHLTATGNEVVTCTRTGARWPRHATPVH